MQRSKFTFLSTFAIALAGLSLVGCGAEEPSPTDPDASTQTEAPANVSSGDTDSEPVADEAGAGDGGSGSHGEAIFTYGEDEYVASLEFCSLTEGADALFHGVARDSSGADIGYLDGDFTILDAIPYGEVRINFGSSGQFESSDEFIALGEAVGDIVVTDYSDTSWFVIGSAWDENGSQTPSSKLQVNC